MRYLCFVILLLAFACNSPKTTGAVKTNEAPRLKALIIDGQNNHGVWPKTSIMMKDFLEDSELFDVDIYRTKNTWQGPHSEPTEGTSDIKELMELYPIENSRQEIVVDEPAEDLDFSPNFSNYDVVISNLGWQTADWPESTQKTFEKYMLDGGGFVAIHAANNAWPEWEEYNKMIGVGGWSDRNTAKDGPQIYYDAEGKQQEQIEESACGSHGPQTEFVVKTRAASHPIMKDIPDQWLHTKDELYERLCGPAKNMTVLATAFSDDEGNAPPWDPKVKGADRDEPVLMAIEYGQGRIFHSILGHTDYSMECVGFMTTFIRGCEWASTGKVSYPVPSDFPTAEKSTSRAFKK